MVIVETRSPSKVAKAVAVDPLGPDGVPNVTDGVEVYPLPPFVTVILSTV